VTFAGSHGGDKIYETDDDEDDGPGVAEVKETAAHFRQEKKNANGDDHDGPHEAADVAALAIATNTIAHLNLLRAY
jgi:hypothetical protein